LLDQPGNSWVGEKVLATSSTFNNQGPVQRPIPECERFQSNPCTAGAGNNRIYAVSVFDGSPVANLNNQNNMSIYRPMEPRSRAGRNRTWSDFLFSCAAGPAANGTPPPANQEPVVCMSGAEVLGVCHNFNSRLKTVWSEQDAN